MSSATVRYCLVHVMTCALTCLSIRMLFVTCRLGILWSDVDQVSKLMTGYEYDIVSFVFLKPFIEELVFRGLLFARLCRICGSLPAAVISSAAFAMTYSYKNENINLQVFNDAFWVGFVLCYTMRLSGRLWLPVVLRYGASFLVYTQCESASPLNADDNDSSKKEMREMIGEVSVTGSSHVITLS